MHAPAPNKVMEKSIDGLVQKGTDTRPSDLYHLAINGVMRMKGTTIEGKVLLQFSPFHEFRP
jgi:hypothetical protein